MPDYMLRVLNDASAQDDWPAERELEFVQKCEVYIKDLQARGQLIAAQPIARTGIVLSGAHGTWREERLALDREIQVGYYLVRAESLADAVAIAKGNPEFDYSDNARVEVRPLTEEEEISGYSYPTLGAPPAPLGT